jgi:hypothetical protein
MNGWAVDEYAITREYGCAITSTRIRYTPKKIVSTQNIVKDMNAFGRQET